VNFSLEITILVLFLAILQGSLPVAEAQPDGKGLFTAYCSPCHGKGAIGEDPASPSGGFRDNGTLIAPALNGTAHAWHHGPEILFGYVKDGSPATESPMPGFSDKLMDDEIWSIIKYYQSLWPERIRKIYEKNYPGGFVE